MPELESSQRSDRMNFLNSSESHDPRYPVLYQIEGEQALSLFAKIGSDCRLQSYKIVSYHGGDGINAPVQMPDRLFTGALTAKQAGCVRAGLPQGYQLSKLERPTNPALVGWKAGEPRLAGKQLD